MSTRRDQAQAYRFLARRQTAALLRGDPDSPDAGERRLAIGMFCGLLVAALVLAGFGIAGLIAPGRSTGWRDGRSLVVEKGSQTRFIYAEGALHPVLNYASARLLLGASMRVDTVGARSLRGVPRGLPVGIPGAPDELPTGSALLPGPWTTCSLPATDVLGTVRPYVRLTLGETATPGARLGVDRALLVSVPGGARYLVWNDQRFRIAVTYGAAALGYGDAQPLPVGAGWLGTVPAGPDLAPPRIAGRGRPAPAVGARHPRIGQLFTGDAGQAYVALADGLSPLPPTQAALLLADPGSRAAYAGHPVTPLRLPAADLARAPQSRRPLAVPAGLPARPPPLADSGGAPVQVCAAYTAAAGAGLNVVVSSGPVPPAELAAVPPGAAPVAAEGGPLADAVAVPPGRGAYVRALGAPGGVAGTAYLVTDLGLKYPLPGTEVPGALGLGGSPTVVPASVLGLLRTGPRLDPATAALTVAPAGGTGNGAGVPVRISGAAPGG